MKHRFEYTKIYQNVKTKAVVLGTNRSKTEEDVYKYFDYFHYKPAYHPMGVMRFKLNEEDKVVQIKVLPWKS